MPKTETPNTECRRSLIINEPTNTHDLLVTVQAITVDQMLSLLKSCFEIFQPKCMKFDHECKFRQI
jgi:hypothetical protein